MRILGLDFGTKRIGVAISDELLITAQGMETLERKDLKRDLDAISGTVRDNNVSEVVVGLPLNMDGSYSAKTKEVVEFMDNLSKAISVPVKTWDERMTTMQARRVMAELETKTFGNKHIVDRISATLMLQEYMKTLP